MKLFLSAAVGFALCLGLFVCPGWLLNSTARAQVRPDTTQLQLKVERAKGELLLTWNPDAEVVKNASKALLSITDGDQQNNVDLGPAQLAIGQVLYSPSTTDVRFEMRVIDKSGKTTTEQVRLLAPQ
jgi:hypothetical protein